MYHYKRPYLRNNITIYHNKQTNTAMKNIDYNTCDFKYTPLYFELSNCNEDKAIELINNGCKINYQDKNFNNTPIGIAFLLKLYKVLNKLLELDIYIDYNNDELLLKFITEYSNINFELFAKKLIEHNLTINDNVIKKYVDEYIINNKNYNYLKNIFNVCLKYPTIIDVNYLLDNIYKYYTVIDNDFIKNYINDENYQILENIYNYNNNNLKFTIQYNDNTLKYFLQFFNNKVNSIFKVLLKTGFKIDTTKYDYYYSYNEIDTSLLYFVINNSKNDNLYNMLEYLLNNGLYYNYSLCKYYTLNLNEINKGFLNIGIGIDYNYDKNKSIKDIIIKPPKSGLTMLGHDPLIDALKNKNIKMATLLLDKNININKCYFSAVYFAIQYGYEDILDCLIKKDADISGDLEDFHYSYIYQALYNYNYKVALKLLQNGAKYDYNFKYFYESILAYVLKECKRRDIYNSCKYNIECLVEGKRYNKYFNIFCPKHKNPNQDNEQKEIINFLIKNDNRYNKFIIYIKDANIPDIEDIINNNKNKND